MSSLFASNANVALVPSLTSNKWDFAEQLCAHLNIGEVALVEVGYRMGRDQPFGHFLKKTEAGWSQLYAPLSEQVYQYSCLAKDRNSELRAVSV